MKIKAGLMLAIVALFALVPVASAWNLGVHVDRTCTGVTVTADPKNQNDGLFYVWKPVSVVGTGFFAYTADDQTLSGTVTITWQKFGKITGRAYNDFHSEDYDWSKTRQHSCPPFYETCDETTDWVLVSTSDWAYNPDTGLMERTLSFEKYDVRDQSLCGSKQETETREPEVGYFSEPADCEGWEVYENNEGTGIALVDAGVWENPLVDESFFHDKYGLQIDEPQTCFEIGDDVSFEADCDEWSVYALTLVDGEVVVSELVDSGEWRNPYRQESVIVEIGEQEVKFYEPVECVQCKRTAIGEMFTLVGPNGEVGYLASYQRNPNTGDWAIPNVQAQQACLGFQAVAAPNGETIYRDCTGEINIVCYRCQGGADEIEGAYRER